MNLRANNWPKLASTDVPWDLILRYAPSGLTVIDLETTGLSPAFAEILEIAALKLNPDQTVEYFHQMVRPCGKIDPASTAIHGIRDVDVAHADPIEIVLPRFFQFMGPTCLIAHNALFDGGHLVWQGMRHQLPLPPTEIYCSCRLARYCFPQLKHHSLAVMATYLQLQDWHHHQAMDDTVIALKVVCAALAAVTQDNFVPKHMAPHADLPLTHPQDQAVDYLAAAKAKSFLYNLNVFAPAQDDVLPEHLKELPRLCQEQALIKIKFAKGHHPHQWRPLKITSILPTPQGAALYGFCLQSKMFKTFRMKYIEAFALPTEEERASLAADVPSSFTSPWAKGKKEMGNDQ